MLPFFRNKKRGQIKKYGKDSAVSSEELFNTKNEGEIREIETELSFHPSWNLSKEDEYVYRFLNNDLTPVKSNQVVLSGVELVQTEEKVLVNSFVRNGLPAPIVFEEVELFLLDEKKNVLATQEFDLNAIGQIPARSSRPWQFIFEKDSFRTHDIPSEKWTLAFNIQRFQTHRLVLDESWKKQMPSEQQEQLEQIVEGLPPLKEKEFNVIGLAAKDLEDGSLHITGLLRNGQRKNLLIRQLTIAVLDAKKEVVAEGVFNLSDFELEANASTPWSFVFPKDMKKKSNPDYSVWGIKIIK
ncbi:accessory Sec system S-layer assembly protein [Rossellomorea vietnamensis]|uniref:Accessory Sec system S-layer assembly protein n=1 Tax=Rossellomorea vietnamensis TaxID=218284 RepID=A0A5D4KFF8_9BACI|nr:accessory Sec system S-layer assembly protein [Rossellomorea vietnamensis]TYR76018.1 accessory Sec system S-layer assembly protein [Rossellomorea vietnamensis]